jgi:DAK2 domain fusion protein YloV
MDELVDEPADVSKTDGSETPAPVAPVAVLAEPLAEVTGDSDPAGRPAGEDDALFAKYPAGRPVPQLDANDFRQMIRAAYDWLAHNHEQVNRLNVFPVPDGDTGTNMLLTIRSAWNNVVRRGGQTVGSVAEAAAEGAHQGSRGNSGVILGQILRGFAQTFSEKVHILPSDMADALRNASENAYNAVPAPVEGTILTVAREMSSAAADVTEQGGDIRTMLENVVEAGDVAVQKTPDQLPALKKAGVVDSGGKGLYYVFEGMLKALRGEQVRMGDNADEEENAARDERQSRKGHRELPPIVWGFDVQYLIEKPRKSVAEITADIQAMGDCPLVEGDERLVKVHVHVFDPGVALAYGVATGFITDVVVENMDDMAAEAADSHWLPEGMDKAAGLVLDVPELSKEQIGLVVVSPGDGFSAVFRNLGAHAVVEGGQSMNPSVAEIAGAIQGLASKRVIVLPNNRNVVMAAQQAGKQAHKEGGHQVVVVPTRTAPQGVAATMVFSPTAEKIDSVKHDMEQAIAATQTGEVTQGVRTAEVDGLHVTLGDIIGLHNGKLVSCGSGVSEVALDLLQKMGAAEASILTIYYGDFLAQSAAEDFAETVRGEYPDQDVELAYGGQPHYHFILSAE